MDINLTDEEAHTLQEFIYFWLQGDDPLHYGGKEAVEQVAQVLNKIENQLNTKLFPQAGA